LCSPPIISGSSLPLIFCIHVRSGPIYWGVIYLAKKIIRWWYFTCKKHENIICDGNLHVKHILLFQNPLFYMYIFYKIYLQWIYWTLFFYRTLFYDFRQWTPRADHAAHLFESDPYHITMVKP
jgi:hypothetical protein